MQAWLFAAALLGALVGIVWAILQIEFARAELLVSLVDAVIHWPTVAIVAVLILRQSLLQLVSAIAERVRNEDQAVVGPWGMELPPRALQSQTGAAEAAGETPPPPVSPPAAGPDGSSAGLPQNEPVISTEEALRLASLWHYQYLSVFLQPSTHTVLLWLHARPSAPAALWSTWGNVVPIPAERDAIVAALIAPGLVKLDDSGVLRVTPYGESYLQWFNSRPDPQFRAGGGNPPCVAYGSAPPGGRVDATVRGRIVASANAGADGFWMMQIPERDPFPRDGDWIFFALDGIPVPAIQPFLVGGAPDNAGVGWQLRAS